MRLLPHLLLAVALWSPAWASESYLTRTWQVAADGDTLLIVPVWYVTSDSDPESQIDMMSAPNTQHQTGMAAGSDLNLLSVCGIHAEVTTYDVPKLELALDLRNFRRPEDVVEELPDETICRAAIGCLQRIVGDLGNVPPIKAFTISVRAPNGEPRPSWSALAGRYQRVRTPWK